MKKIIFKSIFLVLLIANTFNTLAQDKPQVAFLGTFHFAGTSDILSLKVNDLQTDKRQKEMQELVEAIAKYRPTKVLLEDEYGSTKLDSLYQLYLNGKHELSINERQQVGFRLAKQSGNAHVYPVDHMTDLPFGELMEFLQNTGQMESFNSLVANYQKNVMDPQQKLYAQLDLTSFFAQANSDQEDALNRGAYLEFLSKYVSKDNDIGVRLTTKWWERNFYIMSNIDKVIEPGDRILVFFGGGHTALLKQFYKDRNDVEYVDIIEYLK